MDHPSPVGLDVASYVASAAIVVFVAAAFPLLFQLRGHLERFVRSVERVEAETKPLARELVETLRELTARARNRSPAKLGFQLLRAGVGAFVQALWGGRQEDPTKARAV